MSTPADLFDVVALRLDRSTTIAKPVVPPGVSEQPLDKITDIKEVERAPLNTSDIGLIDNTASESTEVGTRNILSVYDQATPSELDFWSNWYVHASEDVKKLAARYNVPFGLVAAAVAILSPGNKWAMNLRAAERAIRLAAELIGHPEQLAVEQEIMQLREELGKKPHASRIKQIRDRMKELIGRYKDFGAKQGLNINAYPVNVRKAVQVIDSEDPAQWVTGPKVQPFLKALLNPQELDREMVLDGHALNIWSGQKRSLKEALDATKPGLRQKILQSYKDAAAARQTNTRALQAVTWYIWKSVYSPEQPVLDAEDLRMLEAS